MPNDKIETVIITIKSSLIAGTGGMAYYLYQVSKGAQFRFYMFIINILLAGYIGHIVGMVLPQDVSIRDAVISLSGFSCFPILAIIENKFPTYLANYILNKNKKG